MAGCCFSFRSVHLFRNIPCNCHAGDAGLHQAAGDARTVADGVQARDGGHEALVHQQFAGVELHRNAVKQGILAVQAGDQVAEGLQRFHNAGQMTGRQHEGQVARYTGIPTTKQGRKAKLRRMTGCSGCLIQVSRQGMRRCPCKSVPPRGRRIF